MKDSTEFERPEAATFGFAGRLRSEFPSQILMDITEVCNLACTHCPHPDFKVSSHYGARYLDPELNEKMIEEVREHGQGITKYIRYASNGEPLVHPNCYDMIDAAVAHSGVYVTLTTNGTIMNEKRTIKLLEAGVHMIDISIDAHSAETYAKIRVNGDLNVTRANVHKLIDMVEQAGADTRIVVSYVEQPENQSETQDFESYWQDAGADHVIIRRLHSCSGAKADLAVERRDENQMVDRYPCLYPWERIVVNARGDLAFCPSDWVHGSYISSYRDVRIKDIWVGKFYKELREAHMTNSFSRHQFCGQCPDWRSTRWPSQGRAYADLVEEMIES